MRILFLALALSIPTSQAWGKCASGSLRVVSPAGAALPLNGRIVVEAFGDQQGVVAGIAKHKPVLRARDHVVPLQVVAVYKGEVGLNQAVLAPTSLLRPNTRYVLQLSGLANAELTTGTAEDRTPPRWVGEPRVGKGTYQEFGCGPAVHVPVSVNVEDTSSVLILATVTATGSAVTTQFLIPVSGGEIRLGRGMCSGPNDFHPGREYRASLLPVDLAGLPASRGAHVVFVAPGGEER